VRLPPFQTLVDAHSRELHRFLVASIGAGDAEDCLQETLLSALRAYPRLRDASNLRAWLYTIAQHKATDALRRRGRRPAERLEGTDGDGPARPEPSVAAHEVADDGLWSAVRGLPPKQRAAVVHRFVFDLAYADIGERIGCSEEAARQNVAAGLRRLRREVTE
jgi:RNA polymerase sigma factor (sigma-70 family)